LVQAVLSADLASFGQIQPYFGDEEPRTNEITPSANFTIYFDAFDILSSATGTKDGFSQPLAYALRVVLVSAVQFSSRIFFQADRAGLI
jgi:hypothetical protein